MRSWAKRLLNATAVILATPLWAIYLLTAICIDPIRVFPGVSQFASLIPGTTGQYLRRAFYWMILDEVGADSVVGFGTTFSHRGLRIGTGAYLGSFCVIGDATIGDNVLIGSNVSIINGNRQHGIERLDIPMRDQPGEYPRITIGCDTWIGDRAVVMANVGEHAVVGAGSVVTKPVPDYAIVVGNPARAIGDRRDFKPETREMPVTETTREASASCAD